MPFQAKHIDAGSFLGSWPVLPSVVAGQPVLLPRTMQSKATILGIQREPSAGYDVDARSFILNVDGTPHTVTFSYVSPLPLSEVISQINTQVGAVVAADDNGFLKLQSVTIGGNSYLKVETDPTSSPTDVLLNLGLFPETEAYAGDFTQAQHVDPDRQVASPGQMSMAEGENFEARVFNRALASLAINNDRNEGLLSKKRIAAKDVFDVASYSVPGAVHGVQLSGGLLVYAGRSSAPSIDDLKKLFALVDSDGRELSKILYVSAASGTGTFSTATDGSGKQLCTSSVFNALSESTYEAGSYYVTSANFTGGAAVLNDKPLKILEIRGGLGASSEAVIENIDPATGGRVVITDSGISFSVVRRDITPVVVDGVFENVTTATAGTPRLENVEVTKRSSVVPTRVELGNRIVCAGEDFTSSPAIQVGDLVTWAGATINSPYNNNGTYRVDKIIDPETIQVVGSDWGSALINPAMSGGSVGTLTISTDGDFILDPFLRFPSTSSDAVPDPGDAFQIEYLKGSTIREATDDNPAIFQSDVRSSQGVDTTVTRAILRMWGPSVTSLDDVLYGDYRINLEDINARLNEEHYSYDDTEKPGSEAEDTRSWGRHKDIRPDTINMWNYSTAETRVYLRGTADMSAGTLTDPHEILSIRDVNDVNRLSITSLGHLTNRDDYDFIHAPISFRVDETDRGRLWSLGSGDPWQGMLLSFEFREDPGTSSMSVACLQFSNMVPGASLDGFDGVVLLQLICDWNVFAESKGFWGSGITMLDISVPLSRDVTVYEGYDYVTTITHVNINPSLSANLRVLYDHYGIYIADILNAGTGLAGDGGTGLGSNYAIYTNSGWVRFGDKLIVAAVDTESSITTGIAGDFVAQEVGATPTGGSVGFRFEYQMQHTVTSTFTAAAMWVNFSGPETVTNVGSHSILRLTDLATPPFPSGTHYGLYIDTVRCGSTNYAIYTNTGSVHFGDLVTGVEGFSAPMPNNGDVALDMLVNGTAAFKLSRYGGGEPMIQWDTGDFETYAPASNYWRWYIGSSAKLMLSATELSPAVSEALDLGSSSYYWKGVRARGCYFSSDSYDTFAETPWTFYHKYNDNTHTGSSGAFTITHSIPANELSGITTFSLTHGCTGGSDATWALRRAAYISAQFTPGVGTATLTNLTGLYVDVLGYTTDSQHITSAYGIVSLVNVSDIPTTTSYGIHVEAWGATTNNWAIYAASGDINLVTGGMVAGNPTGGLKGMGTINAKGVYDDNTLLTCYVLEQAIHGTIDLEKWDKLNFGSRHSRARSFEPWTLDLEKYIGFWKEKGYLPSLPSPETWSSKGKLAVGDLSQRLWETAEVQAVHTAALHERLSKLEKEVARLTNN